MKRSIALIVVMIIACAGSRASSAGNLAALSSATTSSDSLQILESIALVSASDPDLAKRLSRVSDIRQFRTLVEKFESADPERWSQLQSRMQFCREKGYAPPDKDVRVRMVLEHGVWSSEWVELMECNFDTCVTWIYTYSASPTQPNGLSVVCEGDPGGYYPTRISSQTKVAAKLAGPFYPFVMPALLPEWGSDSQQVSVGVTVPGDQFSQPTLDSGVVQMQLRVYEQTDSGHVNPIAGDEIAVNLAPLRAVLARSEHSLWRNLGASGYLGCRLTPGEYVLVVTVTGDHLNQGKVSIAITVPEKPVFSDLILIRDVGGTGLDPGVQRGEDSFYSVSRPEFMSGIEVTIRLECKLPPEFGGRYNAWATLVPIPEIRRGNQSGRASSLNAVYWEDENGSPKYGATLPAEVLEPVKRDANSITLLDRAYQTQDNPVVLKSRVRLSAKPGKYVLSVQITDAGQRGVPLGMKSMVIRILPRL